MSESEFWDSTPRYLSARIKAATEAEQRQWERVRLSAFFTVKTVDAKNKFKNPEDLLRFPWEADSSGPSLEDQWAALDPEILRRFNEGADKLVYGVNSGT